MISVVICTYNRSTSLQQTLDGLAKMEVPPDLTWELVVVDNNSTDNTREVVEEFAQTSGLDVRYVFEPKQGLGRARNAGVSSAKGEIIAFTDDDIHPQADWLDVIHREFFADPTLGVLSGRVELLNPADLPISIRRGTKRSEFKSLDDAFCLAVGCNFAARRAAFESTGFFDPEFGAGSRWVAEDSEFFYRAWKTGTKLVYEPAMLVFHNHGRQGPEAERAIRRSYTVGRAALYAKHTLLGDRTPLRHLYWEILGTLGSGSLRARATHLAWLFRGFAGYAAAHWTMLLRRTQNQPGNRLQAGQAGNVETP